MSDPCYNKVMEKKLVVEKLAEDPQIFLITLPKKNEEVFATISFEHGRAFEDLGDYGLGHLAEHIVVRELRQKFPGADIHGTNTLDHITFSLTSTIERNELVGFVDTVFNPKFNSLDIFDSERSAITHELNADLLNVQTKMFEEIFKKYFEDSCPLSRTYKDELVSLEKVLLPSVKKYFFEKVLGTKSIITIGSNKTENINSELKLKKGKLVHTLHERSYSKCKPSYKLIDRVTDTGLGELILVAITFPGLSRLDDVRERRCLNDICRLICSHNEFGVALSARDLGIYGVHYDNFVFLKQGIITFHALVDRKERLLGLLNNLFSVVERLKTELLSDELVASRVKESLSQVNKEWRTNWGRYAAITSDLIFEGRAKSLSELRKEISETTPTLVQQTTKKVFDWNAVNISIFGSNIRVSDNEITQSLAQHSV